MSQYGIKETKDVLKFVLSLGNNIDKALADDGKITLPEWLSFTGTFVSLPSAINGIADVPKELKDLDEAEAKEISDFIKQELDLADDVSEVRIESIFAKGMQIVVNILGIIEDLKAEK